jgi:hypothetical protein
VLLKPEIVERALDLQNRSYHLLRWVADRIDHGTLEFKHAHEWATLPSAAHGWIEASYSTLPSHVQPERGDLRAFANLFASYLETSFEMVEAPGKQKYSRDAHCFCPMCSWLIDAPRLRTKKLTKADKARARKLEVSAIARVALAHDMPSIDAEALMEREGIAEAAALVAYALDLESRMNDSGVGPAGLALWRAFAWTRQGSPKKDFVLTPALILDAEKQIVTICAASPT